jgi:NAD(P)-dependent dehydrogenase (short-subunit alcohol dehydrogenase family)
MELQGRVAIVTGGGSGIGSALGRALTEAGAKVVLADLDGPRVRAVVEELGRAATVSCMAVETDVTGTAAIAGLIATARDAYGPVDAYFANAGVFGSGGVGDEEGWAGAIEVNLMAHVRAARLLVPDWIERGGGYFVSTASAAGLLTQVGLAPYATTKHAALGFAEWLAVTYGGRGVRVSCVCPMGVDTPLLQNGLEGQGEGRLGARVVAAAGAVLTPEEVAAAVIEGILAERFLLLPHPEVLDLYRRKADDYERWIAGMQRLRAGTESGTAEAPA